MLLVALAGRLLLFVLYRARAALGKDWLSVLWSGFRLDLSLTAYLAALPLFLVLFSPARFWGWVKPCLVGWFVFWLGISMGLETMTWGFMEEFEQRPNRLFLEAFHHPKEILKTVWDRHGVFLFVAIPVLVWFLWRLARFFARRLSRRDEGGLAGRFLRLAILLPLLALMARGSLGHRSINPSIACVSSDPLVNQLGMSSLYSLGYALYSLRHEESPELLYGPMAEAEIFRRVASYGPPGLAESIEASPPFAHSSLSPGEAKARNLVILLEESMGADFVGCLGGAPLTPNLDRLSEEGTLFTNLHATGTRTVRGMEAVLSGFLPTPGRSVVKLGASQKGFFTLAEILRRKGYETFFIYGGEARFDNMRSFLTGNGVSHVLEESDFAPEVFRGIWGVSDDALLERANEVFRNQGRKPFFALMLSTSNHTPFDYPTTEFTPPETPRRSVRNAIAFADFALGRFFDLARKEEYFRRTLFLVVADHNVRTYGDEVVPVARFRIPALLIGPEVPRRRVDTLASQIDLPSTLVPRLGLSLRHPLIGRDLLDEKELRPGRAVLQYHQTHAFMVGDRVVVHRPKQPALHLRYGEGHLHPVDGDPELERDALAHALLPALLYRKRLYGVPADPCPSGGR